MTNPITILAVDDHVLLRRGIASIIASQPDMTLVAEASNGREAVDQYRRHRPDITLMDLQMPEMNGLDAMIAIRTEFPEARIIMLTTYTGDVQVLRAMKVGARGYLLKTLLDKELLETIRAVHGGKKMLSAEASYELAEHTTSDALTPAEIDVLRLIDVRRRLQRARDGYLDALWELNQGRADLAAAVGDLGLVVSVPVSPSMLCSPSTERCHMSTPTEL